MAGGKHFFPMARGESSALLFLILFSAVCFLPVWRGLEIAGMALTGWLLAALMVVSPILTLWVVRSARRRGRGDR
jgi:hypothetical protein